MARRGARRGKRLLGPRSWAGYVPNGIGSTKPNHYLEMAKTAWANRGELPFAWRILKDGCCDGCALGTSGMSDWTLDGTHLCMVRLGLLRLNTMGALDHRLFEHPEALRGKSSRELRELGRLPYPMVWRAGEPGYRRVPWDEALDLAAGRIAATVEHDPDRLDIFMTSRGITNETYYAVQKVARFLGTNNIDNSARICHAPSTMALEQTIGYGATTNSYSDWIGSDLIVLAGTNLANNQPVAMKYLYLAKKAGTRVVSVNPYLEEGLERYWVPSSPESALFGTKILDDHFEVQVGGDAAFFTGALKHLIETDQVNHAFIDAHTEGFGELSAYIRRLEWAELEAGAGLAEADLRRFGDLYAAARTSISAWSMGVTQHAHGTQNVYAISNLALAMGRVGRPGSGLNPIRGHSGVQGGAEMGAVPQSLGLGRKVYDDAAASDVSAAWGFEVPRGPGLSVSASLDAMHEGRIDVLYALGGDFLETMPAPDFVREALSRVPVRIFQDIVANPMMFLEPTDVSIIFPAATRYETPGGVTETSMERRVIFSPEIPGRRVGEARAEWRIATEIAERAAPARRDLIHFEDTPAIRAEIARTIPSYEPIAGLTAKGDEFQWGGERLGVDGVFNTPGGRARFVPPRLPDGEAPEGCFLVSTRRGKQFNSMVWDDHDALTGARRDQVFIAEADARERGIDPGDPVLLRSASGELRGRARIARLRAGTLQVHWPEGNVLLPHGVVDPESGEPDYNAVCELIPLRAADSDHT